MEVNNSSNVIILVIPECFGKFEIAPTKLDAIYVFFFLFSGLNSLVAFVGNGILIPAILKTPSLSTPSFRLVASQAFGDLLMAVYLICFSIMQVYGYMGGHLRRVCELFDTTTAVVSGITWLSITNSAALSFDRFLALHLGIQYRVKVTLKRVQIVILIIWLSAITMSLIATYALHLWLRIEVLMIYGTICFIILVFCYTISLKKLKSMSCNSISSSTNSTADSPDAQANNGINSVEWCKYKRIIYTLIIIEAAFAVLTLPLTWTWISTYISGSRPSFTLYIPATCIWNLTPVVNPLIHIYRMNDVRQACKSVLLGLCH